MEGVTSYHWAYNSTASLRKGWATELWELDVAILHLLNNLIYLFAGVIALHIESSK